MDVNNLVQLNEQGLSMFPSGTWTSHKIEIIHSKIMCLVDLVGMIKHVWEIGYKHFFMIQYMGPPVHPATISLCYKIISEYSHGWPHVSKTLQKKKSHPPPYREYSGRVQNPYLYTKHSSYCKTSILSLGNLSSITHLSFISPFLGVPLPCNSLTPLQVF